MYALSTGCNKRACRCTTMLKLVQFSLVMGKAKKTILASFHVSTFSNKSNPSDKQFMKREKP